MTWLAQVVNVRPETERILKEWGGERLDKLCANDRYDLFVAMLLVAVNQGIDDAFGPNTASGKKAGTAILKRMLQSAPGAYMVAREGVTCDL